MEWSLGHSRGKKRLGKFLATTCQTQSSITVAEMKNKYMGHSRSISGTKTKVLMKQNQTDDSLSSFSGQEVLSHIQ